MSGSDPISMANDQKKKSTTQEQRQAAAKDSAKFDRGVSFGDRVSNTFRDMKNGITSLFESETPKEKAEREKNEAGMEKAKAENKARQERNKLSPEEEAARQKKREDPNQAAHDVQQHNKAVENMSDDQKKAMGLDQNHKGDQHAYDPGDSDGDGIEVSPDKGNMTDTENLKQFGMAAEAGQGKDYYKDTKAAWNHLASVFGDKVTALQGELEGRLGEMTTPTEREVGNPFAGDDVPASKEMDYSDMKGAIQGDIDDVKSVIGGVADIGIEGAKTAGTALKDTGKALADQMGYNSKDLDDAKQTLKDVGSIGKSLSGLGGLFATDNSSQSKVPDGNWKPKSINDLFK